MTPEQKGKLEGLAKEIMAIATDLPESLDNEEGWERLYLIRAAGEIWSAIDDPPEEVGTP